MRHLTPLLLCLALVGCAGAFAAPTVSEYEISQDLATVALSAAELDKPDVSPSKPLRKDCKVCAGKGRYLSGDGLSWIDCTACIPPATTEQPPNNEPGNSANSSRRAVNSDEVVFAESTLPELAARTHRTAALACDCQASGICTCGVNCPCAIKGERDGVVMFYTMDNCPHCVTCERKLREAVKSEKLPTNLRIVKTKDAPSWVKSFPTLHWTTPDGKSHQTHDADVLIAFYNPAPKAAPTSTPTVWYTMPVYSSGSCSSGTCYGGSCSSGSCFSGGCSSGSYGGGGYQRTFQSFGGWSGGGGCASCGR